MRILVNASIYSGLNNGLNTYVSNLLSFLEEDDTIQEFKVYSFYKVTSRLESAIIPYGVLQKLVSLGSLSLYRVLWNTIYLPFLARKFDLVYSFTPHGSPFIKNQMVTVHDLIGYEWGVNMNQAIYYRLLLPFILRNSKKIIAISNFTKKEIITRYGSLDKRIVVIYNGSDHIASRETVEYEQNSALGDLDYVLVVGATYKHKNVSIIVDAFKSFPNVKLVIVHTESQYSTSLLKKVHDENIHNVIFFNSVTDKQLNWLFKNAALHIYPTLKEGFGIPPFEAMHHKTVSLVSDIEVLREVYGSESVIYMDPLSVDDIRDKVSNFLNGYYDRELLLSNGKKRVEEFRWSKTAKELTNLFRAEQPSLKK